MATLTLGKGFVNLVATGQAVSGYMDPDRGEDYEVPGEVRTYAGGRRRSITAAGEAGTYRPVFRNVPRTTVETLRTWQGQLVQVRDNVGRRFVGVYHGVTPTEIRGAGTWDVGFTLTVVTAPEGV